MRSEASGAATAPNDFLQPTEFNAPLFGSLVAQMRAGGRWVVLDTGRVHAATIARFNQMRCRLDIIDLPAEWSSIMALNDPLDLKKRFGRILPEAREKAAIVLCWDFLNYLGRPALTALMRRIAARAQSGATLHALIAYSKPSLPALPGVYYPSADDRLVQVPGAAGTCDVTRYTPKELERHMQGFQVDQRRLLNNGLQEYIFRL